MLVCASSDRDGLSSPGGRPGNPEPAGDGFVVLMASCLPAGFGLLLVLVLAVQTMAWVPFSVLQQWRKKKISSAGKWIKAGDNAKEALLVFCEGNASFADHVENFLPRGRRSGSC